MPPRIREEVLQRRVEEWIEQAHEQQQAEKPLQ
jgi:hypothetical protein